MAKFYQLLCLILLYWSTTVLASQATKGSKERVGIYQLSRGNFSVKFTNRGAAIVSLILPDKSGKLADVVLGFDSVKEYENDTTYFGAIVGRVANRIGGAQYTYNGTHYRLVANEGKNMLHGGPKGFSKVLWKVDKHHPQDHSPYIIFTYNSFDGEEGFPGDLKVKVTYKLIDDNILAVTMTAKAINKATPVNLAQHTYWNLGGHNSGTILSHKIKIFGSYITPVDKYLIPIGKIQSVKGTPYDFLQPHTIGSRIGQLSNGYDINYFLDVEEGSPLLKHAAIVKDEASGRGLELLTSAPGMQFYTSNKLKDVKGKEGFVYGPHAALCLETQGFPDAVNHPNFPSIIINAGETYKHYMLYKFST
ncbi:hypothetical protein Ancab_034198 [Ancistrocladus abbreviatus]